MTETTVFNVGDIIATIMILGFFLLVIGSLVLLVKKSRGQPARQPNGEGLKTRIDELEKRIDKLEKER